MRPPSPPSPRYRPLAVTVSARSDGYRWQLLESEDGPHDWQLLSAAEAPVARYRDAMADGLLALQALIDDLDTGPQTVGELQAAEEAGGSSSAPVPPRKGGAFGFGQLR